jgi:hypothetical protein
MNSQKVFLPQDQQSRLRDLLASADFKLLRDCLAAELADAQIRLTEVAIWRELSDKAEQQTKAAIFAAQKYTMTMESIDKISTDKYQFFTLNITP